MNEQERPTLDRAKLDAFGAKALADQAGAAATVMVVLGDRLGLFQGLAAHGPATSAELAACAELQERYVREWLCALAAAGYLEYDRISEQFTLPPEQAAVLAEEGGPFFQGGVSQLLVGLAEPLELLAGAFREGGGVPQAAYGEAMWCGLERLTAVWVEQELVQHCLPAMPEVQAKLERGARVADVGCGNGRALIRLAQAYPHGEYSGFDLFRPNTERAAARADATGLTERVRFETRDAAQGLPDEYDVILTLDVIHDAADPRGLLRAIRRALRPGGIYVCQEPNESQRIENGGGAVGTLTYAMSLLYCLTTSLAQGGAGLGALGLPEAALRTLCLEVGFSSVRRVPVENVWDTLYEIGT